MPRSDAPDAEGTPLPSEASVEAAASFSDDDESHADAHVEHLEHLFAFGTAPPSCRISHRRGVFQAVVSMTASQVPGQHARQIVDQIRRQ